MTISKPFKGIATGKKSHENANQYSRIFYGDQNLCEQWITYAQTILTQMLMLPGTQTRHVMATPDVSVNVTCRPNRIEINAGGEEVFATYPDIFSTLGDIDNFGYDDRLIHSKNFKYVTKQSFYAGSNMPIYRARIGGNPWSFDPGYGLQYECIKGYTISSKGIHVVSWSDNNIYINGLKTNLFGELIIGEGQSVRGCAYAGNKLVVLWVNESDWSTGLAYTVLNINVYSVSTISGLSLTLDNTYILFNKDHRQAFRPIFLDEKKLILYDALNSSYGGLPFDTNGYGTLYTFDKNFLITNESVIWTNILGDREGYGWHDKTYNYKGEYLLSFFNGYEQSGSTTSITRLIKLSDYSLININTFNDVVNLSDFDIEVLFHQYIFANNSLNIYVYLEYRHVNLLGFTADLCIDYKGAITTILDVFSTTVYPTIVYKCVNTSFDGKTLIICFLDYSLLIDCTNSTLNYIKLNYRLDGIDCTDISYRDVQNDITPLSVTSCDSVTSPFLQYT